MRARAAAGCRQRPEWRLRSAGWVGGGNAGARGGGGVGGNGGEAAVVALVAA